MKLKVAVYPNPFSSELNVSIETNLAINTVLKLSDKKGNLIRMIGCPLQTGENKMPIANLGKYVPGDYLLEIKLLNGDLVEGFELIKL